MQRERLKAVKYQAMESWEIHTMIYDMPQSKRSARLKGHRSAYALV